MIGGSPQPPSVHSAAMSQSHDKSPSDSAPEGQADSPVRLQKILASAGLGSRRQCEELILTGRVEVDRQVVTELGAKADPARQEVRVDGVSLPRTRLVYFMVNKPSGVLSTNNDPSGRPRVIDLVPYTGRLFTVGRLDMSSEGLILVTNDGDLADRLTHPRYGVRKTYQVEVAGSLDRKHLEQLSKGVHLSEGLARAVSAKVLRQYKQSTLVEIVLAEGRNREIRRILARVGHKVERLKRVAIGPLRLADLPLGQVRPLDREELKQLKRAARGDRTEATPRKASRPKQATAKPKSAPAARVVIGGDRKAAGRPSGSKPRGKQFATNKSAGEKPRATVIGGSKGAAKPHRGKSNSGKPSVGKTSAGKPSRVKSGTGKPHRGKPSSGKPSSGKPHAGTPKRGKPSSGKAGRGKRA